MKIDYTAEGPGPAQRGFCHMHRGTLANMVQGYHSLKRKMCKLALVPHAVAPISSFLALKNINKSP